MGLIPVAYAPSSVVLDKVNHELIVANDRGVGTRYSFEIEYGVTGYNTHQDNGTVSIVPLSNRSDHRRPHRRPADAGRRTSRQRPRHGPAG
jgi:hypothetical protein